MRLILCQAALIAAACSPAAADVLVRVDARTVRVLGTAAAEQIRVTADDAAGVVTVESFTGEVVAADAVGGPARGPSVTVPARDRLAVFTRGGGDRLELRTASPSVPGTAYLSVEGGGDNVVSVEGVELTGRLTVVGGAGADAASLVSARVDGYAGLYFTESAGATAEVVAGTYGRGMAIVGGPGADQFDVRENDRLTLMLDTLRIFPREGDDRVRLQRATLYGLYLDAAEGDDRVTLAGCSLVLDAAVRGGSGGDTLVSESAGRFFNQAFGDFTLLAGFGDDVLDVERSYFAGRTLLDMGAGLNAAEIDDTDFGGNGGLGEQVRFRSPAAGGSLSIEGDPALEGRTEFRAPAGFFAVDGGQAFDAGLGGSAVFFEPALFWSGPDAPRSTLLLGDGARFLDEFTAAQFDVFGVGD